MIGNFTINILKNRFTLLEKLQCNHLEGIKKPPIGSLLECRLTGVMVNAEMLSENVIDNLVYFILIKLTKFYLVRHFF